jgi:hypothetical protein
MRLRRTDNTLKWFPVKNKFEIDSKEIAMRHFLTGLVVVSSLGLWAGDKGQTLNVKTGLWEVTSSVTTSGAMPISPGLLQKLTPDQRARMEERMKARSGQRTRSTTHQSCLTQEELEKGPTFNDESARCSETILSATSSKAEVKMVCEQDGIEGNGILHLEALDPENVKGSVHVVATGGGNTMNSDYTFTSKWISSSCAGMK